MKRYFHLLALLALACCSPEDPIPEPTFPDEKDTPKPVVSGPRITAPTLADGTVLSWTKGDKVLICDANSKTYALTASDDGNTVVFAGNYPSNLSGFKALCPSSSFISSVSSTNFNIKVDNIQKGIAGGIALSQMPMVFNGTGRLSDGFTFVPVCGVLKFNIAGSDIVSVTLSVEAKDENYLGGDIVGVNTSTLNTSVQNAKTKYFDMTMKPSTGNIFTPGEYAFCLLSKKAARSFSGYTITYRKADGSWIVRKITNTLSLTSGCVVSVPGDENTGSALESTKISGTVKNATTGAAIAGVRVSDGIQVVETAADGSYSFTSDLKQAQNVFVIMPAEYEFSVDQYGTWADHSLIDVMKAEQQVDFSLIPRKDSGDRYRILLLGDPQQMSSRAHSGESWTLVTNAINAYRSTVDVPLYQISLGDMVTNEIEVDGKAEAYLAKQKVCGLTTFSVPGNHDHVQHADNYYYSIIEFSRWFGPCNYAFDLGRQHFIFLDSVAWADDGSRSYTECLNSQALSFLENDLKYVSVDTPVHIFTHCPLTKKYNGGFPSPASHSRMISLLKGRNVNMWYGHIHFNSNYSYTDAELSSQANGVKSLDSHIVSRCGGNWACSGEVCRDGSPRGFVELDINGLDIHWQFHSIDSKYPDTMYLIEPGHFAGENLSNVEDNVLYCNIYLWDNKWSQPEVWIDGVKVSNMTRAKVNKDAMNDPYYTHFYPIWKAEGKMEQRDEPGATTDNNHLFKYTPSSAVKSVEVRVQDRWGGIHSENLSW